MKMRGAEERLATRSGRPIGGAEDLAQVEERLGASQDQGYGLDRAPLPGIRPSGVA